jgi:ribosome biogenesis protein Nip4
LRTKMLDNFTLQFGVKLSFDVDSLVLKNGCYFLIGDKLKPLATEGFFYAGTFLGKVKGGKFFPSFIFLSMIAEVGGSRVVVEPKSAWLFICGRGIFSKGVVNHSGAIEKNGFVLVLNKFGECLGFGKVVGALGSQKNEVFVQNVTDIGDFLRREQ